MTINFENLVIEAGLEIPKKANSQRSGGGTEKLQAMGVGDSFFVPTTAVKMVRETVMRRAKGAGVKMTSRKVDGGFRFWRVA